MYATILLEKSQHLPWGLLTELNRSQQKILPCSWILESSGVRHCLETQKIRGAAWVVVMGKQVLQASPDLTIFSMARFGLSSVYRVNSSSQP